MKIHVKAIDLPERARKAIHLYDARRIGKNKWVIYNKLNQEKKYYVSFSQEGFTCSCPDYRFRKGDGMFCKHIYSVIIHGEYDKHMIATMVILYPDLLKIIKFS